MRRAIRADRERERERESRSQGQGRLLRGLRVGILGFTLASHAVSQSNPAVDGSWSPPYRLDEISDEPGDLKEIAHAVVLPEAQGRVLFWTQVSAPTSGGLMGGTHTWLWDPNAPQNVTKINVPNSEYGTEELFCGGHTWLPGGTLLAFGGTNTLISQSTGSTGVFGFDPVALVWYEFTPPYPQQPLALSRPRWYPYGFVLPAQPGIGNRLVVLGHDGTPIGSGEFLDVLPLPGLTGFVEQSSRQVGPTSDCDPAAGVQGIDDYPRATVLAGTRRLFYRETAGGNRNGFLRLDQNCSSDPMRWDFVATNLGGQKPPDHNEGHMAHYVTYDSLGNPRDTIYLIGGIERSTVPDQPSYTLDSVEKITNPSTTNVTWTGVSPLAFSRTYSNCVILADGSMMMVGGDAEPDQIAPFSPVLAPERFRPPEVFALGSTMWERLADQSNARCYHSVAGLLPDGRVFSAGGTVADSWHSVEIYSPPYLFQGARPVISGLNPEWSYSDLSGTEVLTVTTRPGVSIDRFHLLRNGSITHGHDVNQRFVSLQPFLGTVEVPPSYELEIPSSEQIAPPGYYFLYAVDSNGVPSVGHRIHLSP